MSVGVEGLTYQLHNTPQTCTPHPGPLTLIPSTYHSVIKQETQTLLL